MIPSNTPNTPPTPNNSFISFLKGIPKDTSKPIIGILYAKKGDAKTNRYGTHVFGVMENMGNNTVAIDYEDIYDSAVRLTNRHFQTLHLVNGKGIPEKSSQEWRARFLQILPTEIRRVLKELNIDGIVAPGDWYNYDTPPYHPNEKRPLVSSALYGTVLEDKSEPLNIPVLGICGGLQAYVNHVAGPKGLGRVKDMISNKNKLAVNHGASEPDHELSAENLGDALGYSGHMIVPVEGSVLHSIAERVQGKAPDGQFHRVMVPAAHGGACRNDSETLRKLAERGAEVSAFCEDGIVEALEVKDDHGKLKGFFIQGHPESAIFDRDGKKNFNEIAKISEEILNKALLEPAQKHMQVRMTQQKSVSAA